MKLIDQNCQQNYDNIILGSIILSNIILLKVIKQQKNFWYINI